MRRKHRKWKHREETEPGLGGEGWVEWGGELIWAVGFTEGGVPYGLTRAEYLAVNEAADVAAGAGWARARALLRTLFEHWPGMPAAVEVGRVRSLGEGISRRAWSAWVDLDPDPAGMSGSYVVLLPLPEAERSFDARVHWEARLLVRLATLDLPLRLPRCAGLLPSGNRPALIETGLEGFPLDLRAGRQPGIAPWEVVAQVAAAVHAVDRETLGDGLPRCPGHATRREHALAALRIFAGAPETLLQEAHAWALEHLPPADEPAVLLHGDLLGQNILLDLQGAAPGLIDWEYARLGDPAYDLAIVTRGARRPFQIENGFGRLLEAYSGQGREIRKEHVHLHELCLLAGWYRESLDGRLGGHPPEVRLGDFQRLFRRVG